MAPPAFSLRVPRPIRSFLLCLPILLPLASYFLQSRIAILQYTHLNSPLKILLGFLLGGFYFLVVLFFTRVDNFFTTLNYSSVNEDWRSEQRVFRDIGADHRVLSVTGGGRSLSLFSNRTTAPPRVISIDINPYQNALLNLVTVAIVRLSSWEEYVGFLGLTPLEPDERERLLREVILAEEEEDDDAESNENLSKFWLRSPEGLKAIRFGVIYAGRWERYWARVAFISGLLIGRMRTKLFAFGTSDDEMAKQREYVEEVFESWWYKTLTTLSCSSWMSKLLFKDPGWYVAAGDVDEGNTLGEYIRKKMKRWLSERRAAESFMISLCLTGKLSMEDLPPYLSSESYHDIRAALMGAESRLQVLTADLFEFLETTENRFDAFSLSDVPSFLDQEMFDRLIRGVIRCSTNGARVLIRLFFSDQTVSSEFEGVLIRDADLEDELEEADSSIGYRFIAATVVKEAERDSEEVLGRSEVRERVGGEGDL